MKMNVYLHFVVVLSVIFYHWLAFAVFQLRNPKANVSTFYSHYAYVVTWRKLERFQ